MLRWQQVSVTTADSIIAQAVSSSHTYLPSNPGKHWVFQYTRSGTATGYSYEDENIQQL